MIDGSSPRALLAQRNVALLLAAELLISGATTALTTTLGWQGYQRTHDPLTLGLIGLVAVTLFIQDFREPPKGAFDLRGLALTGLAVVAAFLFRRADRCAC